VEPCQFGHEHKNKALDKMHLRKRQPGSSMVSGFLLNPLFKEINIAAPNEIMKDALNLRLTEKAQLIDKLLGILKIANSFFNNMELAPSFIMNYYKINSISLIHYSSPMFYIYALLTL
jgi:hypothetical protein